MSFRLFTLEGNLTHPLLKAGNLTLTFNRSCEVQPEPDTFPRCKLARQGPNILLCFPDFNFQSIWSHKYHSSWMLKAVMVAWLYIEPSREVDPKRPAGDPVDSDQAQKYMPNRRSDPRGLSYPYWNFDRFHPPCLFIKYLSILVDILLRCGLSPTYHVMPLTRLNVQYDITPTRRYHSILLIQDSLDTGAFSIDIISPALYEVFNVPPDPCGSTAACSAQGYRELIPLP
jgi:hypothetical protein